LTSRADAVEPNTNLGVDASTLRGIGDAAEALSARTGCPDSVGCKRGQLKAFRQSSSDGHCAEAAVDADQRTGDEARGALTGQP
jgi:hypothetical protein